MPRDQDSAGRDPFGQHPGISWGGMGRVDGRTKEVEEVSRIFSIPPVVETGNN